MKKYLPLAFCLALFVFTAILIGSVSADEAGPLLPVQETAGALSANPADVPLIGTFLQMLPATWQVQVMVWAPLLVLLLKVLLIISEYLASSRRFESNSNLQALANGIRSVLRHLPGGAILALLLLGGCVTINNSALSGEKNAVKTDTDAQQNVSPTTSANIPLGLKP